MATTYPNAIQDFPTMQNVEATDGALITKYQLAMENGDITMANSILVQIPNYDRKLITANFLNTIKDTVAALKTKIDMSYNPSITVSAVAPAAPEKNDYWWAVTS